MEDEEDLGEVSVSFMGTFS